KTYRLTLRREKDRAGILYDFNPSAQNPPLPGKREKLVIPNELAASDPTVAVIWANKYLEGVAFRNTEVGQKAAEDERNGEESRLLSFVFGDHRKRGMVGFTPKNRRNH